MSVPTTRILFVGDLHLGRLPARVPQGAAGDGLPPAAELGPGAAWRRACEEAIARGVAAVVLAGDVVHGANDVFKGAAELNDGLRRLADAGIRVLAVAGNHDTRVLPELARRRDVELLGPGGTWSAVDVTPPDGPAVRVVGWSFPEPYWPRSPLAEPPPPPAADRVTLGVLHADLDVADSPYAPVSTAGLAACGYAAWLLGHVHTPGEPVTGGRPFYLGSLGGLDPTETGAHGPVLASVTADGRLSLRRLPLAPLRWTGVTLDLSGQPRPAADLPTLVGGALVDAGDAAFADGETALAVGARVRLTGEVADPAAVRRAAADLQEAVTITHTGRVAVFLDKLLVEVRRACDLPALAAHATPPGLVARRLLVLEGHDAVPGVADAPAWRRQLLDEARRHLADADAGRPYRLLPAGATDEDVRREAVAVARLLLERFDESPGGRRAADPA